MYSQQESAFAAAQRKQDSLLQSDSASQSGDIAADDLRDYFCWSHKVDRIALLE